MRRIITLIFTLLCSTGIPLQALALAPETPELSTAFSINDATAIPGGKLKPGTYNIEVVDHLTDRLILRVTDKKGGNQITFLAVPATGLNRSRSGPVEWQGDGSAPHALRGFAFPGGTSVEFVYPKAEAVSIAKQNTAQVLAIDPSSDDKKLADKKLSSQDLQEVTLWSLTATRVGPDSQTPAISAKKYQPAGDGGQQSAAMTHRNIAPVQVAANEPTPMPQRSANAPARRRSVSGQQSTASSKKTATPSEDATSALPQTASMLPTLMGAGALLLGVSLFMRRLRSAA